MECQDSGGDEQPILLGARLQSCSSSTDIRSDPCSLVLAGTISIREDYFPATRRAVIARKYSKKASADVERAMKKRKAGTLKSGRSGKKVTSRKQAIAIGISEARAEGKKVPKKRKTAKKRKSKK